ncbi:hypothetical protein PLICRDRAFT_175088 [Plicaturopsis crispa FD-325 SS-3]|nr:hypothetical protein PLICRDRAFT_175088 [Plicaturopsis crispa FD-325 SS-3]
MPAEFKIKTNASSLLVSAFVVVVHVVHNVSRNDGTPPSATLQGVHSLSMFSYFQLTTTTTPHLCRVQVPQVEPAHPLQTPAHLRAGLATPRPHSTPLLVSPPCHCAHLQLPNDNKRASSCSRQPNASYPCPLTHAAAVPAPTPANAANTWHAHATTDSERVSKPTRSATHGPSLSIPVSAACPHGNHTSPHRHLRHIAAHPGASAHARAGESDDAGTRDDGNGSCGRQGKGTRRGK